MSIYDALRRVHNLKTLALCLDIKQLEIDRETVYACRMSQVIKEMENIRQNILQYDIFEYKPLREIILNYMEVHYMDVHGDELYNMNGICCVLPILAGCKCHFMDLENKSWFDDTIENAKKEDDLLFWTYLEAISEKASNKKHMRRIFVRHDRGNNDIDSALNAKYCLQLGTVETTCKLFDDADVIFIYSKDHKETQYPKIICENPRKMRRKYDNHNQFQLKTPYHLPRFNKYSRCKLNHICK